MFRLLRLIVLLLFFQSCTEYIKKEVPANVLEGKVFVSNDIYVDSNKVLFVKPGTEFVFEDTFKIVVKGRLIVEGEKEKPVIFRPADSILGWGGIVFDNPTDKSKIQYAVIENGRIFGENVDLEIQDCSFTNNLDLQNFDAVIRVFNGSIIVENCFVKGNNTGEGLLIHHIIDGTARIENCQFYGIADAIEFLHVKNCGAILNNKFFNIRQINGDGIDLNGCDSVLIAKNIFYSINDFACEIGNDTYGPCKNIIIKDNIFMNNKYGIVVKGGSEVISKNNIFYKNEVALKCKVETWAKNNDANMIIADSCMFSNSNIDFQNNYNSKIIISNSVSDKKIEGISNVIKELKFINPEKFNFEIEKTVIKK